MLKEILSISGKQGLFKLVSQARGMLIVESLSTGKRIPAYSHDKVISLGDISIYTYGEDKPLYEIFETIKEKEGGKPVSLDSGLDDVDACRKYIADILPDYDKERVYPNDIKKIVCWYNILAEKGLTDFKPEEKGAKEE